MQLLPIRLLLSFGALSLGVSLPGGEAEWIDGPRLRVGFRGAEARAERIETRLDANVPGHVWLDRPLRLEFIREGEKPEADTELKTTGRWSAAPEGLAWDLEVAGAGPRQAREIVVTLPVLSPRHEVFTPSEHGSVSVAAYPSFTPVPYGSVGWDTGRYFCLPLVSVFDPSSDQALTVALPADTSIPHFHITWRDAKVLELRLKHRGVGAGRPASVRFLLYGHRADYRAVLDAYSRSFPRYFRPVLPRGPYEGTFWYHHIHAHPGFEEMARQGVRFIWSSFWFTHLGEYLPEEKEWEPYTFARWWKLGETMSDAKIRAFARTMHEHAIGTFAYFNVTEYGGAGGKSGTAERARRLLEETLADALIKDSRGRPIPTWEGSMAMNPGAGYALRPFLREQVRRHLDRLPELDGFVIDRLDWASRFDYGHDDGFTMVGERAVENLAVPVADAVEEVCRLAHGSGKRVYVNQFWRVELLRDVDGYCHEYDYPRGLGYLAPFRPVSAWNHATPYRGDLLAFEAQLKQRLEFAVFPQMIARQFPISQQDPDPEAAGLLEIYAPLFATLRGKRQVLAPHCVEVGGPNAANLYVNGKGEYVVPLASRIWFLSRGGGSPTPVTVTLRGLDADAVRWAHVVSADGPPYRANVSTAGGSVAVVVEHHQTASMVVLGAGEEPRRSPSDAARIAVVRSDLFPRSESRAAAVDPPAIAAPAALRLKISGVHVGAQGVVEVFCGRDRLGPLTSASGSFPLTGVTLEGAPPVARLVTGDDGTWFVPESVELLARQNAGRTFRVARWSSRVPSTVSGTVRDLRLHLGWIRPEEVIPATAVFRTTDATTQGDWQGRYGGRARWIAAVTGTEPQNGYALSVHGQSFTWDPAVNDTRVLAPPEGDARRSTCWFDAPALSLDVTPPDRKPYRLTAYVLDFDRHGRQMEVTAMDDEEALDRREISSEAAGQGIYLTWRVTGPVRLRSRALRGQNTVVSAIFIDAMPGR